ncbi:MAG: hypothetical protein ACSHWU_04255, partial [Marinicella sp.]
MKNLYVLLLTWSVLTAALSAQAESIVYPTDLPQELGHGDVRVPLENYIKLIEDARNPDIPAPASYAIGQSSVAIKLQEQDDRTSAQVTVNTRIEVFEDQWSLIPILPYGAAITAVSIDGKPVQLVQNAEWMSWSTNQAGTFNLQISYSIDASRSDQGHVLPVPIPRASSTQLTVEFTGNDLDMAVIPAADVKTTQLNNINQVTANIPTTSAFLLSWRMPTKQPYVISRAKYQGQLQDKVFTFAATYQVEVFTGESIHLPVLPNTVTLNDVTIDGIAATILDQDGYFKVLLKDRGKHEVSVIFQAMALQFQGPPSVTFPIPRVAISEFELVLEGKKDITFTTAQHGILITQGGDQVSVQSSGSVHSQFKEETTIGQVFIPMTDAVSFAWIDAIPKDLKTELRANANIYHAISAEEGVLYGKGLIDYEITHGETATLTFQLPLSAQVNRITAESAGISDWTEQTLDEHRIITVFLDRKISTNFQLQVEYEQLLGHQNSTEPQSQTAIKVPLIKALNMHRQRGIVALLVGSELTLKPTKEQGVTRVGENQLPAFIRNQITQTIAHTFKYTSDMPQLSVETMAPIRKQGKYDAQVDTLISLGEVTMRGSAGVQIDVKSGTVLGLVFSIPSAVNVLHVTGPSLRSHKVISDQGSQLIQVEFTQEMTGQFQLEVNYENILGDSKSELSVPTIQVKGAEVQHGRIAVEALTAVEVQAAKTVQLSTLEINELPQQLVLKTTNPILLAFKYVSSDTPHQLNLKMTRHQELTVQVAAIETARYQTLITDDGLAVTTARFDVRNSRLQFLRLSLPQAAEVWSVFVDGQAEKPANANSNQAPQSGHKDILIKMLNSATGFPVEVVYATPMDKLGLFGSIQAQLPQPDMVVTHSYWDVYLPVGPNYQAVETNMDLVKANQWVNPRKQSNDTELAHSSGAIQVGKPLRMTVPKQGIQYSFEKLYANQSDSIAGFQIRYASSSGNHVGLVVSIISVLMIWLVIFAIKST